MHAAYLMLVFPTQMERVVRAGAGYTAVDPESRRVVPTAAERKGKTVVKMVYVVLEAQYQVRPHFAAHWCHVDGKASC